MRNGSGFLAAMLLVTLTAACGGDAPETFEAEEAATPELGDESNAASEAPVLTGQFQPPADAPETNQVSGTVRIFPDAGADGLDAGDSETLEAGEAVAEDEAELETDGELAAPTTADERGFRVEVALNGLSEGEHAWHIHSGPCGETAPVVVAFSETQTMDGLAESLEADEDGSVESSVTVPAEQLSLDRLQSGEYSIHVHQQGGVNHGPTVACADLTGGTSTM